jgi:hypothetical protein
MTDLFKSRVLDLLNTASSDERYHVLNLLLSKGVRRLSLFPDLIISFQYNSRLLFLTYNFSTGGYDSKVLDVPYYHSLKIFPLTSRKFLAQGGDVLFLYDLSTQSYKKLENNKGIQFLNKISDSNNFFVRIPVEKSSEIGIANISSNGKIKVLEILNLDLSYPNDVTEMKQLNKCFLAVKQQNMVHIFFRLNEISEYGYTWQDTAPCLPFEFSEFNFVLWKHSGVCLISQHKKKLSISVSVNEGSEPTKVVQISPNTYAISYSNEKTMIRTYGQDGENLVLKNSQELLLDSFPPSSCALTSSHFAIINNGDIEIWRLGEEWKLNSVIKTPFHVNKNSQIVTSSISRKVKDETVELLLLMIKITKTLLEETVEFL